MAMKKASVAKKVPVAKKVSAPKTATMWVKEHARGTSNQTATMVCVALETVSPFRHWFGKSGQGHKWAHLPDALKAVVPSIGAGILEWGSANCAEIDAAVKALGKGAQLKDLVFKAASAGTETLRPPCLNCRKWAKQGT